MTKPLGMTLAAAGIVCLAVAGCNSSHPKAHAEASAAASAIQSNPQMAAAQAKIQACIAKSGFITHADRVALINCIAPSGSKAAVEQCLQTAAIKDNELVTKADRQQFEQLDAPSCVVTHG